MSHIFISYARENESERESLRDMLKQAEKKAWIDLEDIQPSSDWKEKIKHAILSADAFVYLLSRESITSPNCRKEYEIARKFNKRFFLILLPGTSIEDLPDDVTKIHILEWDIVRTEKGFKKFLYDIDTDHEWLGFHTDILEKANLWEEKSKDTSRLLRGKALEDAERQLVQWEERKSDPKPVNLQREFLLESRKQETRFRRSILVISVAVLVVLVFVINYAFSKSQEVSNTAATVQAQETNAVIIKSSQATAQAREATAQADATEQETISLARKLATDAKDIFSLEVGDQVLSGLLAVESMKLYPNIEALKTLQSITLPQPVSTISIAEKDDWVTALSFSPDEETKYLVGGTRLGYIHVWETSSGKEVFSANATSEIKTLDFNGQYIVAGDYEGNVYVWDALNGNLNFVIEQNSNIVGLQFAQYGKYIVSVENGDNVVEIHVWDVGTGDEISSISYNAALQSFEISSDGKLIALSTSECELYEINSNICKESDVLLFEIESGREIARLRHPRYVESMSFTSNYDTLITGSSDGINGFVSIWSDPWMGPSQIFLPNIYSPVKVAGSPDGLKIATSNSDDQTTRIYTSGKELSRSSVDGVIEFSGDSQYLTIDGFDHFVVLESGTGEEVVRIGFNNGHSAITTNLRNFYRNKNLIAKWDCDDNKVCSIQLWGFGNGNEVSRSVNLYDINSIDVTSDGTTAVTGGYYYGTKVWDVFTGKRVTETGEQDGVTTVSFSPDGKYFVAGGDDGTARIWETQTGNEVTRVSHEDYVTFVSFSPDGNHVVSGSDDRTIKVWDSKTGTVVAERDDYYGSNEPIILSPDGKYVASVNKDNGVTVWELLTGKEITKIPLTDALSMKFSKDGSFIVLGNSESKIQIRRTINGEMLSEILCDCGEISSVDISPNDKYFVTGSGDGTVRVWDVSAYKEVLRMYHDSKVTITSFSLDGNYVLSGSDDYTARVWDIVTGNEVARMTHTAPITVATFSPDGKYVLSAGVAAGTGLTDGVRVWLWQPKDNIVTDVCLRLPRSLTKDEWDKYIGDKLRYEEDICFNN
ncbi:MAG: TIR domain-containing protein [Anaerolineae bacterium]|nr:TIR domain-containing protein [Anaerolineae bacterium]